MRFYLLLVFVSVACTNSSESSRVTAASIPSDAAIVYTVNGHVYVADSLGDHVTQITFGAERAFEHAAVSFDRRYVVANEQLPNPDNAPGGHSILWLYDLVAGTERRLASDFMTAGNGGVDWDENGFIYFCGKRQDPFPNPGTQEESLANAGANDIYRMLPTDSTPKRLVNTPDQGECDVSVSEDGTMIAYGTEILATGSSEIWVAQSDGSSARQVYVGGIVPDGRVADPELSPDNRFVVFSHVNTTVPPNFPDNPAANTAHDIFTTDVSGNNLTRLTVPGPISIAPDWKGNKVLFLSVSEKEKEGSVALVAPDVADQQPQRLRKIGNIAKWVP